MNGGRLVASAWFLLGVGCQMRPYEVDPPEINARYSMKYQEPCNAWLRSPRTGYTYCSSPPLAVAVQGPKVEAPKVVAFTSVADGPTDEAALRTHGEALYNLKCVTCHQPNGAGVPGAFPPLVGAGGFYGDAKNHANIIVNGLNGEIEVLGVKYNGAMPKHAEYSDYDIAAVATFERTSWGNADGVVLPADVAAVR
ncbi:MAG: cytochrome c [Myxococcota bacterium]